MQCGRRKGDCGGRYILLIEKGCIDSDYWITWSRCSKGVKTTNDAYHPLIGCYPVRRHTTSPPRPEQYFPRVFYAVVLQSCGSARRIPKKRALGRLRLQMRAGTGSLEAWATITFECFGILTYKYGSAQYQCLVTYILFFALNFWIGPASGPSLTPYYFLTLFGKKVRVLGEGNH